MRLKTFRYGKPFGRGTNGRKRCGRHLGNGRAFDEIHHRQPAGEPRRTRCGQHMVWPAHVIADGFGSPCPKENRSGMGDLGGKAFGVGNAKLQMFGGYAVGQRRRFSQARAVFDLQGLAQFLDSIGQGLDQITGVIAEGINGGADTTDNADQ